MYNNKPQLTLLAVMMTLDKQVQQPHVFLVDQNRVFINPIQSF